jgi:5-deoxy-glucuronate isomerase
MKLHHRPSSGVFEHGITPETVGWKHLHFQVLNLEASQTHSSHTNGWEQLLVVLGGSCTVQAAGQTFILQGRKTVFDGLPYAVYMPPGTMFSVEATANLSIALGGAPATGTCPLRLLEPKDYRVEMRGGANVSRQVTHVIAPPLCEKLFVFEVYTPSGNWAGFPPHRHDGRMGSSYLEETYYFKVLPQNGFGSMRVYTVDTELDEFMLVQDGDLVLVPEGYHPTNTAPGSNLYFLNFLAGPGTDYTVVNDPAFDWVKDNWTGNPITLPLGRK